MIHILHMKGCMVAHELDIASGQSESNSGTEGEGGIIVNRNQSE